MDGSWCCSVDVMVRTKQYNSDSVSWFASIFTGLEVILWKGHSRYAQQLNAGVLTVYPTTLKVQVT
jgi:hypothetical protein